MKRMKVSRNADIETTETNLLHQLGFRYLPYWPLFAILLAFSIFIAFIYLKNKAPLYEVTTSILIKDEKRGLDNSKVLDELNVFGVKKIVENEIEVLHSRSIISQVVNDLSLYAPLEEKSGFSYKSAYLTSPVRIELAKPESLVETERVTFNYDAGSNLVFVAEKAYHLNEWRDSPWGKIRFSKNPLYEKPIHDKQFFFSLVSVPKEINDLQNAIEISPSSKLSTVININLKDAIPERGEAILNDLVNDYNKASINDKNLMAANTLDFVERRLEFVGKELDTVENGIQKFRTQNSIVDISQQSSQYLRNVSDNDQKVAEMDVQMSVLDQIEKYVLSKHEKPGLVPTTFGITDPLLTQLLEKLYDSEIQYEKLRKTTAEDNPILLSVRNEIAKITPSILENINNQRNSIEAARTKLAGTSSRYNAMLNRLPEKEKELVEISRQQNTKTNIYSFLLQKKEEANLSFNAAVADSRVIDKAQSSTSPVSPKPWMVYLIALLFPIPVLGCFISIKELVGDKILFRHTIEEYTVLPVIGELACNESNQLIVANSRERTLITEQFRNLRSSLAARLPNHKGVKIMVTSSIAGEGKSFIANNLAIIFAQAGKKVALIEADMYKPKLSKLFNLSNNIGLSNSLQNDKLNNTILNSYIHPTDINKNLFVMPAGNVPDSPSELLMNENIDVLMRVLENQFDLIIIDSVPVRPVSDAYSICRFADLTLFVIRHGVTPKANVRMLDEDMEMQRLKNVNIVFNCIKKRGFGTSGYGYAYGYGYNSNVGYGYFGKGEKKRSLI